MESKSNRAVIKRFIKRYLILTEGIDYLFVVPAASAYFIIKANFTFDKLRVFLVITVIVYLLCSVITVLLQRYLHKPFLEYAGYLDRGEPAPADIQIVIRERFVGLFMPHIIEVTLRWLVGFGIIAVIGNAITGITFNQLVAGWTAVITAAIVSVLLFGYNGLILLRNLTRSHIFDQTFLTLTKTNKTFFGSTRNTIIGTVTLILILLSLLLTVIAITIGNNSLEYLYSREVSKASANLEIQIEDYLEKQYRNAHLLARNSYTISALSGGDSGKAAELLMEYTAEDIRINNAYLSYITPEWSPHIVSKWQLRFNLDQDVYLKMLSYIKKGKSYISEVIPTGADEGYAIIAAAPVKSGTGVSGFLSFIIGIDKVFYTIIEHQKSDSTMTFMLCDAEGNIIGQSGSMFEEGNIAEKEWGKNMLSSSGGIQTFEIKDVPVMAVGEFNEKYKFHAVAAAPESSYQAYTKEMIYPMIINGIAWMIIIVFLLYRMLKLRLKPIQEYRETLTSLAEGDFTARIKTLAGDEIGMVATALNLFIEKIKDVVRRLTETSSGLSASSGEMNEVAMEFADSAQNQAAMVEEINASVEEISAGIDGVTKSATDQFSNMKKLTEMINDLSGQISRAAMGIDNTKESVESITLLARDGENKLQEMSRSMEKITGVSKDVSSIIDIISKISDNIDLLSLNAAIEAARAGEAGKGFAVVAEEINKLAEKTAQSIQDINSFIMQNNAEVELGQKNVADSESKMRQIIAGVDVIMEGVNIMAESLNMQVQTNSAVLEEARNVGSSSEEIKNAVSEQRLAIEEVAKSMGSINEISQQSADGSEEIRSSAGHLARMADALKDIIRFFKT